MRVVTLAMLLTGCALDSGGSVDAIQADFGRIGPVSLGMSQAQISTAIGDEVTAGYLVPAEEQECYYLRATKSFTGIGFMMNRDHLVRFDVWESTVRTTVDIGLGSTESDIKAAYTPPVVAEPHKYSDGRYLIVAGADGLKLLFETDATGVITQYRSGREPAVNYVEGCL